MLRGLAAAALLVLAAACGGEPSPSAAPAPDFCADLEAAATEDDLTGLEAPSDLSAAEAEGFRMLAEPGLGAPEGPQQEQAVTAFAAYLDGACPGLVDDVLASLDVRTDPIDPGPASDSPAPSSPSPTSADDGPFCASWSDLAGSSLGAGDVGAQLAALQAWLVRVEAEELSDGLPAEVAEGLATFETLLAPLDADTVTQRELERVERDATPEQEARIEAFGDWVDEHCGL